MLVWLPSNLEGGGHCFKSSNPKVTGIDGGGSDTQITPVTKFPVKRSLREFVSNREDSERVCE